MGWLIASNSVLGSQILLAWKAHSMHNTHMRKTHRIHKTHLSWWSTKKLVLVDHALNDQWIHSKLVMTLVTSDKKTSNIKVWDDSRSWPISTVLSCPSNQPSLIVVSSSYTWRSVAGKIHQPATKLCVAQQHMIKQVKSCVPCGLHSTANKV